MTHKIYALGVPCTTWRQLCRSENFFSVEVISVCVKVEKDYLRLVCFRNFLRLVNCCSLEPCRFCFLSETWLLPLQGGIFKYTRNFYEVSTISLAPYIFLLHTLVLEGGNGCLIPQKNRLFLGSWLIMHCCSTLSTWGGDKSIQDQFRLTAIVIYGHKHRCGEDNLTVRSHIFKQIVVVVSPLGL